MSIDSVARGLAVAPKSLSNITGLSTMLRNGGLQILSDRPTNQDNAVAYPAANIAAGAVLSVTNRTRHRAMFDASHISLVFGHWTGMEVPAPSVIKVRAAIQKAGTTVADETGVRIPVTFGGKSYGEVPPDGILFSDPVGFNVAKGDIFYTRVAGIVSGPSVGIAGAGNCMGGIARSGVNNGDGYGAEDLVMVGATTQASNSYQYTPIAVMGYSTKKVSTVCILGDSIGMGKEDLGSYYLEGGYLSRVMQNQTTFAYNIGNGFANTDSANFAHVKACMSGQTAGVFAVPSNSYKHVRLAKLASTVIFQYGTNDVSVALATMQANLLTIAGWFTSCGIKFIACTITPRTTSSDLWATVVNQTISAYETVRSGYNSWLRDTSASGFIAQAGGALADIWDGAAGVEVNSSGVLTLNGGFWPAPYSLSDFTSAATTGTTTTYVLDSAQTWTIDQWRGYVLQITSGAGAGDQSGILNMGTAPMAAFLFGTLPHTPGAGDTYKIYRPATEDGVHPTTAAHQAIANYLNTSANLAKVI